MNFLLVYTSTGPLALFRARCLPRRRASRRHPSTMKDRVSCRRHHRHHRLRCRVSCRRVSHLLTHTGTVRLRNCTCVLAGFDDNVLGSMAHGRARRACPRTRKLEPHCCAWRWPRYRPDDTLHLGGVAVARQHVPVRERSPAGARAVARKQHPPTLLSSAGTMDSDDTAGTSKSMPAS